MLLDYVLVASILGPIVAQGMGLIHWPEWLVYLPLLLHSGLLIAYVIVAAVRRG